MALSFFLAIASPGAACAAAPMQGQDACASIDTLEVDAMRMPFEIVDGRVYVQARVDGRGPFRFGVDTGASGMARADASLASLLGLAVGEEADNSDGVRTAKAGTIHLESIEIGTLARTGLDVITRDYNGSMAPDAALSGIIGREFFADGLLIIDYPNRTISFSRMRSLSPTQAHVLTYERAFRVPVSIGGLETEGNLDTGANVAFVLPRSLYDRVATGRLEQAGRGRLANGTIETGHPIVPGPFRISGASLSDVEVRVSDRFPELLVGAHALRRFVLMIDQRSKSVAVCEGHPSAPHGAADRAP